MLFDVHKAVAGKYFKHEIFLQNPNKHFLSFNVLVVELPTFWGTWYLFFVC